MGNFIKKYKSQVIVGVVASLITALIMWVGKMFMSAAPKVSSSIIETVVNWFYSFTATRTTTALIYLIGLFLIIILFLVFFLLYLAKKSLRMIVYFLQFTNLFLKLLLQDAF